MDIPLIWTAVLATATVLLTLALAGCLTWVRKVAARAEYLAEFAVYEAGRCPLYVTSPALSFPFLDERIGRCTRQVHVKEACSLTPARREPPE